MNTTAEVPIEFYYPKTSQEFSEEQLRQHMRIPGSISASQQPNYRTLSTKQQAVGYKPVFFGAAREWVNDEEGWEHVGPRRVNKKWIGTSV